jgi:antitoxin ParD1/3/4
MTTKERPDGLPGASGSFTLTDQKDSLTKSQIEAGHYTNDREYTRDLIRREQERSAEIDAIRAALIEGAASGKPKLFDVAAFKRRMLAVHV